MPDKEKNKKQQSTCVAPRRTKENKRKTTIYLCNIDDVTILSSVDFSWMSLPLAKNYSWLLLAAKKRNKNNKPVVNIKKTINCLDGFSQVATLKPREAISAQWQKRVKRTINLWKIKRKQSTAWIASPGWPPRITTISND